MFTSLSVAAHQVILHVECCTSLSDVANKQTGCCRTPSVATHWGMHQPMCRRIMNNQGISAHQLLLHNGCCTSRLSVATYHMFNKQPYLLWKKDQFPIGQCRFYTLYFTHTMYKVTIWCTIFSSLLLSGILWVSYWSCEWFDRIS